MRRLLVALSAAALGVLIAGCTTGDPVPVPEARRASPQQALLEWVETYSAKGGSFTFRVHSLEVLENGWRAEISMKNETELSFAVGDQRATLDRVFGLMLFQTGDLAEVERRNTAGSLPSSREATAFEPELPLILEPNGTWRGVMSAPGALAAGRFVRVVFGALVPVGDPPEGFPAKLVWITDSAYELLP